jgi:hypothetical protein
MNTPKLDAAERERQGMGHEEIPFEDAYGPIPKPGEEILEAEDQLESNKQRIDAGRLIIEMCEDANLGSKDIEEELKRRAVSVSDIPVWYQSKGGMGDAFNKSIGGGIGPRRFILIGGKQAGAGKTSFAMQLVHGLAMRNAELPISQPITPVIVLSEMAPVDLKVGMLRRWSGLSRSDLKSLAVSREGEHVKKRMLRDLAMKDTKRGAGFMRFFPGSVDKIGGHQRFMTKIADAFDWWADDLRKMPGNESREVWPVLLIDSLQVALGSSSADETTAQSQLAEHINDVCRTRGLIVVATCETSKESAKAKAEDDFNGMFRGSYRAIHKADIVIAIVRKAEDKEAQPAPRHDPTRQMWTGSIKCRDGDVLPSESAKADFKFLPAVGRFEPVIQAETANSKEEIEALMLAEKAGAHR